MNVPRQSVIGALLLFAVPVWADEEPIRSEHLQSVGGAQRGDMAPDYLGETRDGDEIRVSQFRGKVVVVSFWASWCGICVQELPIIEGIRRKWAGRVEVVGVNFKEDSNSWRKAMRRLGSFTMTFTRDRDGAIGETYGVNSLPRLFMIDKEGRIAHAHKGYDVSLLPTFVKELNELVMGAPQPRSASEPLP